MSGWQPLDAWRLAPEPGRFAGHFPGQPVVPGACVLDAVLLRLAVWCGPLASVPQAKFPQPAPPGVRVRLACRSEGGTLHFRLSAADDEARVFCIGRCQAGAADPQAGDT